MGSRVAGLLAAGVFGSLLLAGCGSSPGPKISAYAMQHPKIIANTHGTYPDAFYRPNPIRVRVGQTITWTSEDNDLHNVVSVDNVFASYPLPQGGVYSWKPVKPGTYYYFCTFHPEMHGEIIVRR